MIEQTLTDEERTAATRLRAVWFPNRIVLHATAHWIAKANHEKQFDHAFRALRWCKWQWVKCLYNPREQTIFDEQFRQYYRLLKVRMPSEVELPPNTAEISADDLMWISEDLAEMKQYLDRQPLSMPHTASECELGARYNERHLWGPFDENDAGLQMHFWPVVGCFSSEAVK